MRLRLWLIGVLIVLAPCSLWAVIGTPDVTPAATLLFPYFAVDLDRVNGQTTLITIQAATATGGLGHVTLWTDLGIPTYAFDIYLTGYDMQAINVRDIFAGIYPSLRMTVRTRRTPPAVTTGSATRAFFRRTSTTPVLSGLVRARFGTPPYPPETGRPPRGPYRRTAPKHRTIRRCEPR